MTGRKRKGTMRMAEGGCVRDWVIMRFKIGHVLFVTGLVVALAGTFLANQSMTVLSIGVLSTILGVLIMVADGLLV